MNRARFDVSNALFFQNKLLEIGLEVPLELQSRLLNLLLLLGEYERVLKVLNSHSGDQFEKVHVLSELQTHEVTKSEKGFRLVLDLLSCVYR